MDSVSLETQDSQYWFLVEPSLMVPSFEMWLEISIKVYVTSDRSLLHSIQVLKKSPSEKIHLQIRIGTLVMVSILDWVL